MLYNINHSRRCLSRRSIFIFIQLQSISTSSFTLINVIGKTTKSAAEYLEDEGEDCKIFCLIL